MMHITKKILSLSNRRAVGILKVLSITKLANIFESLTGIGKPFNYSVPFSFYYHICTEF